MDSSWDKISERFAEWMDEAMLNLPNIFVALIVFIIAFWLSKNIQNLANRYLKKVIQQASVRGLVSNALSIIVITIGLLIALRILNLDQVLKSILATAGVAGLAVGLALQGTLANTFSGIFLALKNVINIGDWVVTNGYEGRVIEIELRNTKIKEADNNIVVIPNKMVLENPFKNYGLTRRIRTKIECGVAYDSDLRFVKKLAIKTINELFPPYNRENIEFHYLNFGDSAINFQIRFWLTASENLTALEANSDAIIALKVAFDEHNIEIPFPIRTVILEDDNKNLPINEGIEESEGRKELDNNDSA